jgi:acetyltransferase-like isoleucine patch superfamily enzyme
MVQKIIKKIIAKILNSTYVLNNPYVDLTKIGGENKNIYSLGYVTIGSNSKLLEGTCIHNLQNDKSKIVIGNGTMICSELLIFKYGGSISIGNNSYLGKGTRVWSGCSVSIGSNVLISHNCNIVDTDSHEIDSIERSQRYTDLITNGHWDTKGSIKVAKIEIKDYAWISFGVTILKGVTIGEGAIIGANSVVTKDVPDYTVAIGNPAKIIRNLK